MNRQATFHQKTEGEQLYSVDRFNGCNFFHVCAEAEHPVRSEPQLERRSILFRRLILNERAMELILSKAVSTEHMSNPYIELALAKKKIKREKERNQHR